MLFVILYDVCYTVWCVLLYFIVLFCTVLCGPVLHCSTLPPGINPFAVNNNNNNNNNNKLKLNSVALVRERTIPTERPPPVGEVSANFCG